MKNSQKKGCLLLFLLSSLCFAQNLTLTNGVSINISSNTEFFVNGLSFNPSADFAITSPNSISRSSTAIDPQSINRVFNADNVLSNFQGTMTFFYEDSELNGVNENNLVLQVRDDFGVWNSYSGSIDTSGNNLVYTFASPIDFDAITASANGITLFTNSLNKLEVKIYPNPVTTGVHIITDFDIHVTVYNSVGQKILSSNKKNIDLSQFSNGAYIMEVKNESTQLSNTYKVIKN